MAQSARTPAREAPAQQNSPTAQTNPPLTVGQRIVYFGDDQNGVQRVQHAMVLAVIGDPADQIVDVHIFNGAMVGGSQDASGTFVPESTRKSVPHAPDAHSEGWWFLSEYEAQQPTEPPAHVDQPHAYQEGVSVYCTMGNWEQPPTSYAYQWRRNGAPVGDSTNRYDTVTADIGTTVDCVVTTPNMAGSTSVTSNAVVVEAPAGSRVGENETHVPT